ncbi:ribosomal protein S19 family protein, partial [Candidatus Micrarchaeota archaeon]|nr:ribosomal protein S19 family protein [Candidatus Micrarchaeota archaeon]MBU1939493.1 ribosomal protein S19 family protein [Candidatus Micrarchaeota archaeon]
LLAMSIEDFAKLLKARARRSVLRGIDKKMMKKVERAKELVKAGKRAKPIKTHKRATIVLPQMVGVQFAVYRGNEFQIIDIQDAMLGHYLGEFALTRKRLMHGKAGIGATKSSTAITAR